MTILKKKKKKKMNYKLPGNLSLWQILIINGNNGKWLMNANNKSKTTWTEITAIRHYNNKGYILI